ncbi:benzoate/H(+) symporter BenE family transporter [Brevibacillus massiliensis]|uniref:benzoate/H(+) symporter BenE family transporter n=1 Tax=Brevibacillus massiliensis TaxID=1118054 RepID=UPI0003191F49|nr:benzoate/H(+) symporter BenE family transporter [Brevibacillus massiliensis]
MGSLRDFPKYLSVASISNGIIAWLFGVTGPLLIVLQSAAKGNVTLDVTISWIFSIYVVGGILTLGMSLYYRQPIPVAFSIPGAVLVGSSLMQHTFAEVVGAYFITGVLVVILGVTGIVKRIMKILPMPIMMGMVSGVLLPFGIDIITSTVEAPLLNGAVLAVYFLLAGFPLLAKRFPPLLAALLAAFLLLYLSGMLQANGAAFALARPQVFLPSFDLGAIGELVIPLTLTVIAIQNAQGIGLLGTSGYLPPVNAMTNWSGIGSLINSFFGAHSACIAGPMTAIISGSDTGPREGRYVAAVIVGILWILFGVFAPIAAMMTQIVPAHLIKLLGGLAMVGVLAGSLQSSFSSRFKLGALFSFIITVSGVSLFHIGAPFWGLVGGTLASLVLERADFSPSAGNLQAKGVTKGGNERESDSA